MQSNLERVFRLYEICGICIQSRAVFATLHRKKPNVGQYLPSGFQLLRALALAVLDNIESEHRETGSLVRASMVPAAID